MGLKWPQFFHKLGSPRWFYRIAGLWLPWLSLVAGVLLLTGSIWGLAFAPEDFKQGNSYRIVFVHVPGAFIALAFLIAVFNWIKPPVTEEETKP